MEPSPEIPPSAKVVIIGGGVAGCSAAYHLARFEWKDIVLLEQNLLAGGTTWHAAGLVGRLRASNSLTRINKYSVELYAGLERETGHPVGWKQVGSLIVARSEARMIQLRRTTAMAEWFGVETQMLDPEGARARWPLLRVDDILGAAWLPHDGKVLPKEVAVGLAKGARARGVTVLENARVLGVEVKDARVTGVRTASGTIAAEYVVIAGGMWARQIGLECGVPIPLYPVEHHYVVTEPIAGARDDLPVGRDPDLCIYFRGEGDAVMLGAFQAHSKPWRVDRVPGDFSYRLLEPDWETFAEPLRHGKWRIPALETARFDRFVNGPESFTPDNNFIMGEAPEVKNLFVIAGFNSVGIASAGGAGKYLAEWMMEGQPTIDLWSVDIRRFGPWANNVSFLRERVAEVLGLHYQPAWPNREFETGRGIRQTPLHERLAARGACFGARNGWERPNWFARTGLPVCEYSFGRQNWFAFQGAEHRAAREGVAVFDQSGFSKYVLKGRDAPVILGRLCGNHVDVEAGRAVYTGMFNERGGIESDLTVVRLGRDEFYIVSGTSQTVRDYDWIRRQLKAAEAAELVEVTTAYGVLGVMGPASRTLLARVTDAELAREAFPFGTARDIALGRATVRAVRISYAGELGWELHTPMDQLALVYDTLMTAGTDLGVVDAGHYALNSLRLEKAFRAWGADISPDDTPLEAGLAFAIDWNKPFIGREALLAQKSRGVTRKLAQFILRDPEPVLWGSELIYRNGRPVGYTTSGSYGHTLGAAVALGYVNHAEAISRGWLEAGQYEINVNGDRYAASMTLRPAYDPERKRVLC